MIRASSDCEERRQGALVSRLSAALHDPDRLSTKRRNDL